MRRSGWVGIVNPGSRGARSPRALADLLARLRSVVDDVLISEHAGHVETLVRQSLTADGIVVAGGDGTLFEVLQACDRSRQRIGLLPFGRGNSLARDLFLRAAPDAIRALASGTDRPIDLLGVTVSFANGRTWRGVSASNLAIGYPAAVAAGAARWRALGAASYAVAAAVAAPRSMDVRLSYDGGVMLAVTLTGLILSNSRYVGPFLGFPAADLADGVFHSMEIRSGRLGQTAHNFSSLTGLRLYEPATLRDVRAVRVELSQPALLKIDGELRDAVRTLDVTILPGAVTVRVPAASQ